MLDPSEPRPEDFGMEFSGPSRTVRSIHYFTAGPAPCTGRADDTGVPMHARKTWPGIVSIVGFIIAVPVAAQPTVVGFDDGAEGWAGAGGQIEVETGGGNPGAHGHLTQGVADWAGVATSSHPAFLGNLGLTSGIAVGLDAKVESLDILGSPVAKEFFVAFRTHALASEGYPVASVWARIGTLQAGPDWSRFSITVDPRSAALPAGWSGSGAEDPATGDAVLPPGVTFAWVLAHVDEVAFTTDKPGWSSTPLTYDLRVDNIRIERIAQAPPSYEVVDLGDFGGELANAHDINDAGHVAGTAEAPDRTTEAFLWRNGALTNLGSLMPNHAHDYGVARGMSQNDYLVGESMTPMQGFPGASVSHAFFWSEQTGMIDLTPGTDNMSQAWDVNSSGQVVGNYTGAFLWSQADGLRNIGFGGMASAAEGINENGEVCGYEWNAEGTRLIGWVYDSRSGAIRELPSFGGSTQTRRINDAGDVVGASNGTDFTPHTVLWTHDGQFVDLGAAPLPDYSPGMANALNEARWIVGEDDYNGGGVPTLGWLWIDGTKYDLRTLIADPAQAAAWSDLATPLGINARGEIVGIGIRDGIPGRAFLMRPLAADSIFKDGFDAR